MCARMCARLQRNDLPWSNDRMRALFVDVKAKTSRRNVQSSKAANADLERTYFRNKELAWLESYERCLTCRGKVYPRRLGNCASWSCCELQ